MTYVVAAALVVAALGAVVYFVTDPERLDLDDSVRRATPGQFVRLSDGYTHFERAGPPGAHAVVLAAGFSVPYYIWDPTFKALGDAGFQVLRYDYYGRGYSDRPRVPYNDDLYARQLLELLDSQRITGSIDLAGLSFGGAVITNFADKYPDRVRSLIYFDPAFRSPATRPLLADIPWLWSATTAIFDERQWAEEQPADFLHPERFPDWAARYRPQMRYKGFRWARLSEAVANATVNQEAQVDRVGQNPRPVLVIWGRQDPNVSFASSDEFLENMPRGRLVAVDQSGHLPQWEQPDVVHPALIEFLREVGGSQPDAATRAGGNQ